MRYIALTIVLLGMLCLSFINITRTITGHITDNEGVGIPGASVVIKGTNSSVTANSDGMYSLVISSDNATLVIMAVGFETQEIKVGSSNVIDVKLIPQTRTLNDVVVTGYMPQKKKSITGSVAKVSSPNYRVSEDAGSYGFVATPNAYASANLYSSKVKNGDHDKLFMPGNTGWSGDSTFNTEGYDHITENPYLKVNDNPLSTFAIDVDAASYSNVRRILNTGQLPLAGAVRIEEMINYFTYQYPKPENNATFSVNTEMAACPWNVNHRLALIGLQGRQIAYDKLPASNLVFLIDVSGSMDQPDKLPLVKQSLNLLVDQLREQDKVALVVYAGNAGLVLPATSGANKTKIKEAINNLDAGGSTAGGAGIKLAYKVARENLKQGGNNRVILCTDGDFNVGASSDDELERMIEKERQAGVYLTVLGYGTGNYQDAKMQKLADKGNGNHAYIDGISEAKKVLINEFGGTLFTIAKDVKLQIEFNPQKVKGYRLIGYENRMLAIEDFNNDKKDAGDLGSGHTVTALYEIIPAGVDDPQLDSVDALRYQKTKTAKVKADFNGELMNIKLRYKQPDGDVSSLIQHPVMDAQTGIEQTSNNFRFAAAVAEFGMLLRNSQYKGDGDYSMVRRLAGNALGSDIEGYRKEFLKLVSTASSISDKVKAE